MWGFHCGNTVLLATFLCVLPFYYIPLGVLEEKGEWGMGVSGENMTEL